MLAGRLRPFLPNATTLSIAVRSRSIVSVHGRRLLVTLSTAAVGIAALPAAGLAERLRPNQLVISSHGVSVKTTAAAECRPDGVCIDGAQRSQSAIPTGLPAHGGGTVVLRTGVRPRRITVGLYRHAEDFDVVLRARALGRSGRRFIVKLPPGPPTGTLSTVVHYPGRKRPDGSRVSADALFAVGVREHIHLPPQPPIIRVAPRAVTRRLEVRCGAVEDGWRYCDLHQRGRVVRPVGDRRRCWGGYVRAGIPYPNGDFVELKGTTKPSCRYSVKSVFGVPAKRRSVVVRTDFLGDALLLPRAGRTVRVKLRSKRR